MRAGRPITVRRDRFEAVPVLDTYAVPAPGEPLFQAGAANLNPWTEAKVDTKNPDRGPLLIMDGELDNTVPWAIASASYKQQKGNEGVTEIQKIAGRGHALTIDSGWKEVAESALKFIRRFVSPGGTVALPIEIGGEQDDATRVREKADQRA